MTKKKYVDFAELRAKVSIEQVLQHYGLWDGFTGTGAQRRGACPIHKGTNSRQFNVNVEENLWYCFGECKEGGNVLDLVARLEGCDIHTAALTLAEWFGIETGDTESKPEKKKAVTAKKEVPQRAAEPSPEPEDDEPQGSGEDSATAESVVRNEPLSFERLKHLEYDHEALLARGLMSDTAKHFGVGFCTKGIIRGCIAIPIHNPDGKLLAYAGATPGDAAKPYRWPKGFRPELEVFNAHRAVKSDDIPKTGIIVTTDFFDVFALYEAGAENVVSLMGASVSPEQLSVLESLLAKAETSRIMWAQRAGTPPPFETIGRLTQIASVRTFVFEGLAAATE